MKSEYECANIYILHFVIKFHRSLINIQCAKVSEWVYVSEVPTLSNINNR
jgi:hypothetical protein